MRPPFGRLSGAWSDDAEAARRIAGYRRWTARYAEGLARSYPGVDWEPICFDALYLAAYTFRPGRAGFCRWLRRNLRNQISSHVATRRRRLGKLSLVPLDQVAHLLTWR